MRGAAIVAGYAIRESVRRRVFPVVLVLTLAFLGLYSFGVYKAYQSTTAGRTEQLEPGVLVDQQVLFSATLFGLSIFAVLFLGTVLAIFLTHAVVRGDAERGLLQPLTDEADQRRGIHRVLRIRVTRSVVEKPRSRGANSTRPPFDVTKSRPATFFVA